MISAVLIGLRWVGQRPGVFRSLPAKLVGPVIFASPGTSTGGPVSRLSPSIRARNASSGSTPSSSLSRRSCSCANWSAFPRSPAAAIASINEIT